MSRPFAPCSTLSVEPGDPWSSPAARPSSEDEGLHAVRISIAADKTNGARPLNVNPIDISSKQPVPGAQCGGFGGPLQPSKSGCVMRIVGRGERGGHSLQIPPLFVDSGLDERGLQGFGAGAP